MPHDAPPIPRDLAWCRRRTSQASLSLSCGRAALYVVAPHLPVGSAGRVRSWRAAARRGGQRSSSACGGARLTDMLAIYYRLCYRDDILVHKVCWHFYICDFICKNATTTTRFGRRYTASQIFPGS